jgi:hypothetical protein
MPGVPQLLSRVMPSTQRTMAGIVLAVRRNKSVSEERDYQAIGGTVSALKGRGCRAERTKSTKRLG